MVDAAVANTTITRRWNLFIQTTVAENALQVVKLSNPANIIIILHKKPVGHHLFQFAL